jgi:hypothetical protein
MAPAGSSRAAPATQRREGLMSKVVKTFRSGPRGARARAREELAVARAAIAELEGQRPALLVAEDSIARVREVDRKIAEHRDNEAALQDRIKALGGAVRKAERARLESERETAIADVVQPRLLRIAELAGVLETAVAAMSAAFAELEAERNALFASWPDSVPRPPYYQSFSLDHLRHRISDALRTAADRGEIGRVAELIQNHGGEPNTITALIERSTAAFLEAVQVTPIVVPDDDDGDDDLEIRDAAPEPPARGFETMATT